MYAFLLTSQNTKEDIFYNTGAKQHLTPLNFIVQYVEKKKLRFYQNIFISVPKHKESYTCLEKHGGGGGDSFHF